MAGDLRLVPDPVSAMLGELRAKAVSRREFARALASRGTSVDHATAAAVMDLLVELVGPAALDIEWSLRRAATEGAGQYVERTYGRRSGG